MKEKKKHYLAMGVSYRGVLYNGWQRQSHCNETVQGYLERALSKVANEPISTICAGRTDTKVHATGQVIHFETNSWRDLHSWKMGVNTHLPRDIRINWAKGVQNDFHARFSARSRRYHYIIEDGSVGNAILFGLTTTVRYELDVDKMHAGAQYLLGEKDFSSFRASQCQSNTPYRCIDFINVTRQGGAIVIDIQANAFLYHMVRNIVGALLVIGQAKQPPEWMDDVLKGKDRCKAPATAAADGLYLVEVGYDRKYRLPSTPVFPLLSLGNLIK